MDRRTFIGTVAAGFLAAPLEAQTQQAGKVWRIGLVSPLSRAETGRRVAIKGIETGEGTRYYPVIVTYEPLPSHPLALRLYEEIIYRGGRLKGEMIKPVTLLTTRDVESIEGIVWDGAAWPDLLTRKHTARHVDDSFHNYLYLAFAGEIPRNEYLRVRWHRIGDMIGTRLFGQSMDHSADRGARRRPRRRRRR